VLKCTADTLNDVAAASPIFCTSGLGGDDVRGSHSIELPSCKRKTVLASASQIRIGKNSGGSHPPPGRAIGDRFGTAGAAAI
jgi:hypothetical protein